MGITSVFLFLALRGTPNAFGAAPVATSYRLALEHETPEGLVLTELQHGLKTTYEISYFIGPQTIRTKALAKREFKQAVAKMKSALPSVNTSDDSQLSVCQQATSFTIQEKSQTHVKHVCFDTLSQKNKADFSSAFSNLKSTFTGSEH